MTPLFHSRQVCYLQTTQDSGEFLGAANTKRIKRLLSVRKRQRTTAITAVWSESLWALRKICTKVEESARAMAADSTTIALVSPPPR